MSSGPGDASRLYKTVNGCRSWKLLFTNPDKQGFWDAMAFADQERGAILGDPVAGRFVVLQTEDGGKTWSREKDSGLQSAPVEGAFAASNSALSEDWDDGITYFGTGGPMGARLFYACEPCKRLESWSATPIPMFPTSAAAGIFSVGHRFSSSDRCPMILVGGDYTKPNASEGTVAWSRCWGTAWHAAAKPPHGYRSAVAWDGAAKAWITVGTNGSDISYDDGKTWVPVDNGNWNALSLPWVVGPDGRMGKLEPEKLRK
jgi:hypothetical protein